MHLQDLLQAKVNELNEKIKQAQKENQITKELEEDKASCLEFLSKLEQDQSNVRLFDINAISTLLERYVLNDAMDLKACQENLRIIGLVYEGILSNALKMDLSSKQQKFLATFKHQLQEAETTITHKMEARKDVIDDDGPLVEEQDNYQQLLGKYKDKDNTDRFTQDEFELFLNAMDDPKLSFNDKKSLLIEIKRYNDKGRDVKGLSREEVLDCFHAHGLPKEVDKLYDDYAAVMTPLLDTNQIEDVLSLLQRESFDDGKGPLLNRFSPASLLTIFAYGSRQTVQEQIERMKKDGHFEDVFFDSPRVWINPGDVIRTRKGADKIIFYRYLFDASYQDMIDNEKFLTEQGYDVSLKRGVGLNTLKTPHKQVLENYKILASYGFFEGSPIKPPVVTAYSSHNLALHLDKLIEAGLLHGPSTMPRFYSEYVRYHSSSIVTMTEDTLTLAHQLKSELSEVDYYRKLFSDSREGNLSKDFFVRHFGYGHKYLEAIRLTSFMSMEDMAPLASTYDSIIQEDENGTYSEEIFKDAEIQYLEENYRVPGNDYVYKFGTLTISRPKVLRYYSALNKMAPGEDKLMYCITKGSYVTQNEYQTLKGCVGPIYAPTEGGSHK